MGFITDLFGNDPAVLDPTAGVLQGYDKNTSMFQQGAQNAGIGFQGAQDADAQARNQQMGLAAMLQQAAMGQGPSAAQSQLQSATDRGMQQAMAMAASGRGDNTALNFRNAAWQQAGMGQQAANQSAQLRAQEMQSAQGGLAQLLGGIRGGDFNNQQLQSGLLMQNQGGMVAQDAGASAQKLAYNQMLQNGNIADQQASMQGLSALAQAGGAMMTGGASIPLSMAAKLATQGGH